MISAPVSVCGGKRGEKRRNSGPVVFVCERLKCNYAFQDEVVEGLSLAGLKMNLIAMQWQIELNSASGTHGFHQQNGEKNQPGKVQRHQQAFLLRRRIQLNILMQINPLMSANSRHCREDRRGGCKDISWRNKKMDKRTTIPREFPLRKLKLFLIQFMCLISGKSGDLTPEKR